LRVVEEQGLELKLRKLVGELSILGLIYLEAFIQRVSNSVRRIHSSEGNDRQKKIKEVKKIESRP